MEKTNVEKKPNIINAFVAGAKKGLNLSLNTIIPNTMFAFALMYILTTLGVTDIIGKVLSPVMGIFGLPGEAAMPLVLSYLSTSGGISAALPLIAAGTLTPEHSTIMLPFIFCVGATFQYIGRILAPSGVESKHYKICILISTVNGLLAMVIMRIILNF